MQKYTLISYINLKCNIYKYWNTKKEIFFKNSNDLVGSVAQ